MRLLLIVFLALIATPAATEEEPPLPKKRPVPVEERLPRPDPRNAAPAEDMPQIVTGPALPDEPVTAAEPEAAAAPARIYQAACPGVLEGRVIARIAPPIREGICVRGSPWEVSAVMAGGREVTLSAPVETSCGMAEALADWAGRIDAYAEAVFNSGLESIQTGTSYMCRPRNNAAGADMSEHGFANALDLTGFTLQDGTRISLPEDWAGDDRQARAMRFAHDAACGHFTTVLGPEANALHADHLHLDLGCHGASCTARLCE